MKLFTNMLQKRKLTSFFRKFAFFLEKEQFSPIVFVVSGIVSI